MSRSIEPPPLLNHSFRNSQMSVHSGSSSHRFLDPDVIEIPPPTRNPSNLMKQKEAILHDVIDINDNDNTADLVLIGEKVGTSNKGKTIESIHDGYGDHQLMGVFDDIFCQSVLDKSGPGSEVISSSGYTSVSHNLSNVDGHGSDQSFDDDDYSGLFLEDYMDVDNYALLEAHFDNVNIPPGIEAPIPWLAEYGLDLKKTGSSSLYPLCHTQSDAKNSNVVYSSQPSWSLEPTIPEIQGPSAGNSNLQIKMDAIGHPSGIELSSPQLFSQTIPGLKKSDASQSRRRQLKLALGQETLKPNWSLDPSDSESKIKLNAFGASSNNGFVDNSEAMKLTNGGEPPYWGQSESMKKAAGSSSSYHSNFVGHVDGSFYSPGTELMNPWWMKNSFHVKPFTNYAANSSFYNPFVPLHPEQVFDNTWAARDGNNGTTADTTVVTISDEVRDEILRKFQNFKQFDTIEDTSDHFFVHANRAMKQHSKNWAKRIQEEWKLLEKDLPDSIFVRIYESRIDLLRAVIIGAEGTPYHDGLFFFDVFFPSGYPNVPPQVHYHSGGLRLNPNLYNCGKVCLSLLNTWSGNKNEKWLPGVSTILQVLVSIQGLILNTKPYFNEPGYARLSGSADGEMRSLQYNEDTFILSLKTMVYLIRRPPKNFEDFVVGHFCSRAHDILVACKSYMDGAQVGCLVKGGVQDVDQGDKSCSKHFKNSLGAYVGMLVREFTQIGAKNCEKFLSPSTATATAGNKQLGELPVAAMLF
ncbi:probable ubiquitin-conjugating enzyme E2 25 [Gastrolobium bilobum]|uniref:probable ubiquitin-conjugating enzyme E2 25 n=1 Tax=Gastrolobium bilobum TaxID=150636 RepID=UPI002AAF3FD7|nr:probable ubiquitin-conjugating enzyme E2 25 [Gastrolobium bilobum]